MTALKARWADCVIFCTKRHDACRLPVPETRSVEGTGSLHKSWRFVQKVTTGGLSSLYILQFTLKLIPTVYRWDALFNQIGLTDSCTTSIRVVLLGACFGKIIFRTLACHTFSHCCGASTRLCGHWRNIQSELKHFHGFHNRMLYYEIKDYRIST